MQGGLPRQRGVSSNCPAGSHRALPTPPARGRPDADGRQRPLALGAVAEQGRRLLHRVGGGLRPLEAGSNRRQRLVVPRSDQSRAQSRDEPGAGGISLRVREGWA